MADLTEKEVEELFQYMCRGCQLRKIKKRAKIYNRYYHLDIKSMTIKYDGSKKKFKKGAPIKISKLQEVREGEKDFSKALNTFNKELCFVLVFANHRTLNLMADDKETRDMWLKGLRYALLKERAAGDKNETDNWIRDAFNMADKNGDGCLDLDEICVLLKKLNADIDRKYVKQLFEAADSNKTITRRGKATLDREEFVHFYHLITRRPELEDIFSRYSRGKGYLTQKDLKDFMSEAQMMKNISQNHLEAMFQFEPQEQLKKQLNLSLIGFRNLLVSINYQLFNPAHRNVYHPTDRPITEYFINSSHNTYLTTDQLKGPSSIEAYITALKKGCRCVELDCWDGSSGVPVIYHGHTLTSKINFKDVISAIKNYAFEASPFAVTLSIENHCSIAQQQIMAKDCNEILGDMIYRSNSTECPKLNELMNKIIIKGKKLPISDLPEGYDMEISEEEDDDEEANLNETRVSLADSEELDSQQHQQQQHQNNQKSKKSKKKIKVCPEFSMLTSMKSVGFKDLDSAVKNGGGFSVSSLVEGKLRKQQEIDSDKLNKVACGRLLRIYPAGFRTDSSNYNPVPMWNSGCQIVALNFQTSGESMQLNHGRFLDNGGIGYVLKPKFLLNEKDFGIVTGKLPRPNQKVLQITAILDFVDALLHQNVFPKIPFYQIISGCQIPKPKDSHKGEIVDPFCKIEIHGVEGDMLEATTPVVKNNGLNPQWNEPFTFHINVPELAIVRFKVEDYDRAANDFIGYYALPFTSMQEGYRHFPLYDKYGDIIRQCFIFAHVQIQNATSKNNN